MGDDERYNYEDSESFGQGLMIGVMIGGSAWTAIWAGLHWLGWL